MGAPWRVRTTEHEPIGGSGGRAPSGVKGRATGQWVRGAKPPEAESIFGHWMSNGAGKFSPFPKMHLYFYCRCNGNDMGKFCQNPGGQMTPLAPSWGRPCLSTAMSNHTSNNSVIPVSSWHVCLFCSPRCRQPP